MKIFIYNMEKKYCAPGKGGDKISCLSRESLIKIINSFNQTTSPKNRLTIGKKSKKMLWNQFRNKMAKQCKLEVCWVDQDFVKKMNDLDIQHHTFRPKMPTSWKRKKNTWLTTTDINLAMKQYEKVYPNFLFIGTVARDCPGGYMCELTGFDFTRLGKIDNVGVVYNLDPHYKGGSHWVAMNVNVKKRTINYYDSYGHKPPNEIHNFMLKIQNDLKKVGKKMKIEYNNKRHQYGGSECGIFSMNFLINSIKGKSIKQISSMKLTDKKMLEMRDYLYRNK